MGGARSRCVLQAPFGWLVLTLDGGRLISLDIGARRPKLSDCSVLPGARAIARELESYLCDPGYRPAVPVLWTGTVFQRRVWRMLRCIPSGATRTYGQLARALDTSARAVGQACGANPLPVLIPCHRVVAEQGLGGYSAGPGIASMRIKHWLLHHEGAL
ncbi:MAG: methylated-DNA--[protein]-cysteine S-methyltransferase [Acidiferrobacteraceae bacterium]|jgi:methylated-DNA-[protein]-cysteine S-methyltransferase